MHTLLDPLVLVVPARPVTKQRAIAYLSVLVDWSSVLLEQSREWSLSRAAVNALLEEGTFPTWESVTEVVKAQGEIVFAVGDIMNRLRRVSEVRPFCEERLGVAEIVASTITVDPDTVCSRLSPAVGAGLRDSFAAIAAARDLGLDLEQTCFGTPFPFMSDHVGVVAESVLVATVAGSVHSCPSLWERLPVVLDTQSLIPPFSLELVYTDVGRAVEAVRRQMMPDSEAMRPVGVIAGPEFLKSLEACNFVSRPTLLRRVYERLAVASMGSLAAVGGAKLHAVRENEGPNAKQLKRADGAALWRCMISKEGAGYRLQYWQRADGTIEAQVVVVESEAPTAP